MPIDDEPGIAVFPAQEEIPDDVLGAICAGRILFEAKFNRLDGAGRPRATGDSKPTPRIAAGPHLARVSGPDASACSSCHNEPVVGGSGDFVANAFVGAHFTDPPTVETGASVTNERNTVTLWGSGLLEMLALEMSEGLHAQRDASLREAARTKTAVRRELVAKGVRFGTIVADPKGLLDFSDVEGIDHDLIVKPFGVRGVAISIREFTIAALNQHHGLQAIERFGWERTGFRDFDGDGVEVEVTLGQVTALTLFQAALPAPRPSASTDPAQRARERRGEEFFGMLGCTECHRSLRLDSARFEEPNRLNRPGALTPEFVKKAAAIDHGERLERAEEGGFVVHAFTDLKRHDMCDADVDHFCNERLRQDNVPVELYMTQKLWDVATSGPYGHRGDLSTLSEAIGAHGGEGRAARDAYLALPREERRDVLAFLGSLGRATPELPRCSTPVRWGRQSQK